MKTKTLSQQTITLITTMVIAITFFASAPLAFANTSDTGILAFTNLRERQITNREKIKVNLLQMLSSEDQKHVTTASTETTTAATDNLMQETYSHTELVSITYRLADITDRLESRMLLVANQGTTIPQTILDGLSEVRTELETVTNQLLVSDNITLDHTLIRSELAHVHRSLQDIVAELKIIVTPQV